jgi:hypothetical protein
MTKEKTQPKADQPLAEKTKKVSKISKAKLKLLKSELEHLENVLLSVKHSLAEVLTPEMEKKTAKEQVIEGTFDGEFMVKDKKRYPIPPNYASKSKLVEGDKLKLKIDDSGAFIYKQIEPIERKNLIGTLEQDDKGYKVKVKDKTYRVLLASITYFNAKPGDKMAIIAPEGKTSEWAAVEGVV